MKLLGSLLVGGGGIWCWQICVKLRRQQQRTLERLLAAVFRLAEGIRMERVLLPCLLEQMAAEEPFFAQVLRELRETELLSEAWRQAAERLLLPPRSRAAWSWLGTQLTGDEEHILQAAGSVRHVLEQELGGLMRHRREEDQRTGVICVSSAVLLVILLL